MNRTRHRHLSPCCLFQFRNKECVISLVQDRILFKDLCKGWSCECNQASYSFHINCHFHAIYVTLLNINGQFKPFLLNLEFSFKYVLYHVLGTFNKYATAVPEFIYSSNVAHLYHSYDWRGWGRYSHGAQWTALILYNGSGCICSKGHVECRGLGTSALFNMMHTTSYVLLINQSINQCILMCIKKLTRELANLVCRMWGITKTERNRTKTKTDEQINPVNGRYNTN